MGKYSPQSASHTLPKNVVSFELNKQSKFDYGQEYVTLSRVKELTEVYFKGNVSAEHMQPDLALTEEYSKSC